MIRTYYNVLSLLLSTHSSLLYGGSLPASPASHLAGLLRRRAPSTNPGPTAWCVSVGNWRDVWYVRECDKGGRVVMGVLRRRFCVDMIGGKGIYLFLVGLGYDACARVSSFQCYWLEVGVYAIFCYCLLQQDAERQYCMYVAHVWFYVCCTDSAGVCGDVCGVSVVVKGYSSLVISINKIYLVHTISIAFWKFLHHIWFQCLVEIRNDTLQLYKCCTLHSIKTVI